MPGPTPSFRVLAAAGWLIVVLAAPGLLALVAVVVAFLFRSTDVNGPGYYHVLGFDKTTGGRREATFRAESRTSARGRAELDGIVITDIKQVEGSEDSA